LSASEQSYFLLALPPFAARDGRSSRGPRPFSSAEDRFCGIFLDAIQAMRAAPFSRLPFHSQVFAKYPVHIGPFPLNRACLPEKFLLFVPDISEWRFSIIGMVQRPVGDLLHGCPIFSFADNVPAYNPSDFSQKRLTIVFPVSFSVSELVEGHFFFSFFH